VEFFSNGTVHPNGTLQRPWPSNVACCRLRCRLRCLRCRRTVAIGRCAPRILGHNGICVNDNCRIREPRDL